MLRRSTSAFIILSALLLALADATSGERLLHIGSSGTLADGAPGTKEDAALKTLQSFIKDETGLANQITPQKNWRELARKLAKGELQLGVMQGYEFAWAQQEDSNLKPLALAVDVYPFPTVYVVERKSEGAGNFAGLKGKSLALPTTTPAYVKLYLERLCQGAGGRTSAFFAKTGTPDNVEDALDDVIDGKVDATVVDRAGLEGYKRRKPGRFNQLKPIAHSEPLPPPLVAYCPGQLDDAILQRFRDGLLNAHKKEKGEMMLTLFHLTRFEPVPPDFGKILAETRRHYQPNLDPGK